MTTSLGMTCPFMHPDGMLDPEPVPVPVDAVPELLLPEPVPVDAVPELVLPELVPVDDAPEPLLPELAPELAPGLPPMSGPEPEPLPDVSVELELLELPVVAPLPLPDPPCEPELVFDPLPDAGVGSFVEVPDAAHALAENGPQSARNVAACKRRFIDGLPRRAHGCAHST